MSDQIAIFLPTLKRAVRLEWIVQNIRKSMEFGPSYRLYILSEDNDPDTIKEARRLTLEHSWVSLLTSPYRNINKANNHAYHFTTEPFIYLSCDDLEFTPGCLASCLALMSDKIKVVGTWDGYTDRGRDTCFGNSGYLIDRKYIDEQSGVIDAPGQIYNENYHHFYADTEFFYTARRRGVFEHNRHAVVHHRHYQHSDLFGGRDETSILNEDDAKFRADKIYYNERVHLFGAPYEPL